MSFWQREELLPKDWVFFLSFWLELFSWVLVFSGAGDKKKPALHISKLLTPVHRIHFHSNQFDLTFNGALILVGGRARSLIEATSPDHVTYRKLFMILCHIFYYFFQLFPLFPLFRLFQLSSLSSTFNFFHIENQNKSASE